MEPLPLDKAVVDGPLKEKKRRASKACSGCHSRKIRCDVLKTGLPCSRCREDGFECAIKDRKQRARRLEQEASPYLFYPKDNVESHRPGVNTLPRHIALHQIPHYPFFQNLTLKPDDHSSLGINAGTERKAGDLDPFVVLDPRLDSMPADDVQFLKQKGAFTLPPRVVVDQLVSNYFEVFHPFFPVVDKKTFLHEYTAMDNSNIPGSGPSMLLLQAIIFTSSSSIPLQVLDQMPYASRKAARSEFYQRVKLLYEFDYENDDIISIQALLLMSQYYPSMTMQKHTWFWVQQAISLAQGTGLHRDPGPVSQRRLWARMWWACLIRDRLISLGTGRPMHINSLDCNVPPPTPEDLQEEDDNSNDRIVKVIFSEFLKLCQYMEGVLSLVQGGGANSDRASLQRQVHVCEATLHHWLQNLDPVAKRYQGDIAHREHDICILYKSILHMTYNIVMITLNQSSHLHGYNHMETVEPPLPQVLAFADDSAQLALHLLNHDIVHLSPTICVTAILPPLIVQLLQLQSTNGTKRPEGSYHFDVCMKLLKRLGEVHWHANFYYQMFSQAAPGGERMQAAVTEAGADWLAAYFKNNTSRPPGKRILRPQVMGHIDTGSSSGLISVPPSRVTIREKSLPERAGATQMSAWKSASCAQANPLVESVDAEISSSNDPESIDATFSDTSIFYLEDWLNDFGYFYNDFPSA